MTLALGAFARSYAILAAACALAVSWAASMLWYWAGSKTGHVWGYALIDAALAFYFWGLSRGRWFPVPLFFIHAALVTYYVYAAALNLKTWFWIAAFVNRLFDLSLLYVAGCAIYRIRVLRRRAGGTAGRRF